MFHSSEHAQAPLNNALLLAFHPPPPPTAHHFTTTAPPHLCSAKLWKLAVGSYLIELEHFDIEKLRQQPGFKFKFDADLPPVSIGGAGSGFEGDAGALTRCIS